MPRKDYEKRMEYQREYQKEWYQHHKKKLLEMRKSRRIEIRDWLRRYKSNLCCVNCGGDHPSCLQFHHKKKEDKSFTISSAIAHGSTSIQALIREIEKCEILCGNCHAMRHWYENHDFDDWREVHLPEV